MKIKLEDYNFMKKEIAAIRPTFSTEVQYLAAGLTPKRYRWDLSYAAKLSPFISSVIYKYADDSHVDTALKKIVKETESHKNPGKKKSKKRTVKKNPKTQKQMFYGEQKKIADLNNLFMEMVQNKDITAAELRALIKKRPSVYGRFEGFIPMLEKNPKKRTVKMITKNPKGSNYPFHAKVWRVFLQKVAKGGHRLPQRFWWNGISFNSDKSMAIKYPNQKSAVAVAKSCQKRYSGKPVIFGVTDS